MKINVVIAVLAILLGGLWFALAHPDLAPRIQLTLLDGKKMELAELNKGKVMLVNFWATSCPGCVKEMPGLVETYRGYHAKGFETVAVAMTYDHPAQVLNFTQSHGLPFVVALDVDGGAAQAFGDVQVTPTSFLLDQHGRIVKRITGEIDFPQLRAELNQLLGAELMLWIKALHIIFVMCWFAGLFYLPRLFVNHAMVEDAATRERLCLMEGKLYRFMTPLAALALLFGAWLWLGYAITGPWLHLKLVLVSLLVAYHFYCGKLVRDFAVGRNQRSHVWYRIFNEVPVLLLFAAVFLVVLKPF